MIKTGLKPTKELTNFILKSSIFTCLFYENKSWFHRRFQRSPDIFPWTSVLHSYKHTEENFLFSIHTSLCWLLQYKKGHVLHFNYLREMAPSRETEFESKSATMPCGVVFIGRAVLINSWSETKVVLAISSAKSDNFKIKINV